MRSKGLWRAWAAGRERALLDEASMRGSLVTPDTEHTSFKTTGTISGLLRADIQITVTGSTEHNGLPAAILPLRRTKERIQRPLTRFGVATRLREPRDPRPSIGLDLGRNQPSERTRAELRGPERTVKLKEAARRQGTAIPFGPDMPPRQGRETPRWSP